MRTTSQERNKRLVAPFHKEQVNEAVVENALEKTRVSRRVNMRFQTGFLLQRVAIQFSAIKVHAMRFCRTYTAQYAYVAIFVGRRASMHLVHERKAAEHGIVNHSNK